MKIKALFFATFLLLRVISTHAHNPLFTDSIHKGRVVLVSSSLALALGGSYYYVQNAWWNQKQVAFHFDDGSDKVYALNVDKAGHFLGGLQTADMFASSMLWAGMNEKKALWYGGFFGSALQLVIEVKDGYAPYWGFSKEDLIIGSAGAFSPIAQHYSPTLNAFDVKFSYWKRHNTYWDLEQQRGKTPYKYAWQDDYVNQTYWLSIDIHHFYEKFPDWLNIAIGFGLDETQYLNANNTKVGGNNEWYIALDYDLPKLLKKYNSPLAKKVKHWLNYFHFPAPAIRITPKADFYPLFL